MCWLITIAVVALVAFMVWASADVGSGIYLKSLCRKVTADRVVTLTFDDGPDEEMTPKVLDVLKGYDIKATFFLVGNRVERNSDIVRRIVAEGHTIGNHTFSHKGVFPLCRAERVEEELCRCSDAIADAAAVRPMLFRPPFGVTNPIIGRAVRGAGLQSVGMSIRSLDTLKRKRRRDICERVLRQLHPGAIILLHDRCAEADELLRMLIPAVLERGYRYAPISEFIKGELYEN